ncbi:MAG TPA: trimethylamine methyltransferase family protein [Bacillota bacterium]|nr:trimethylamine methyltransferase family protein [Bacillota bacterium]
MQLVSPAYYVEAREEGALKMRVNITHQQTLGLHLLSEDQLEQIHYGTLEVLERTGVKVHEKEALELLHGAGARVEGNLVKIPAWLVERALATAPSRVGLAARDGSRALSLEKGNIYYGTGSETPFTIDINSGERRRTVKADVCNAARLADALKNIDFVMALALAYDVPLASADVHQFEAMLLNTTKPICFTTYDRRGLLDIIEMAELAAGGAEALREKPNLIHYAEPTAPLQHTREALEKLITCAAERIPVVYASVVMLGATGPVTMAGALVVANAEILSGLVIHQLKAPGAPFIYGGGIPPMDMTTSICSYGAPERDLGCSALVRLSQYYNLPSFTTAGCSDAHRFDQQAGMEAGFNLLISGLAGGNLIHDLGYMGVGMTSCLEYVLLCDEAAGAVKHLLRGVAVNPETLALDLIEKVGPGGHFLSEEHTARHFRQEMYFPKTLNRDNYDGWLAGGGKTFDQKANERVKEILAQHTVPPLPPEVVKEIKSISARSRQPGKPAPG